MQGPGWNDTADSGLPWVDLDALGRRAMLMDILAQVSREALQDDGLDAVLGGIVACLIRRLPVAVASIILLDETRQHFVHEVHAGELLLDAPTAMPWPVTVGAAGRCARTGEAQLIADVASDPDYVPGHPDVRSEYLVPIRHRWQVHGVLNLESTRADFFTHEVCAVFDAVANQIAGAIHMARIVHDLEIANRKLIRLSMSDGLTGIANRRCFDQQLDSDWRRLAREQRSLALLIVDADCFKTLNDARGHLYGDECLRELARLCRQAAVGEEDLVARYGGDELVLLLPGRGLDEASEIAEHLRRNVERAALVHPASSVAPYVTVSVGVGAALPVAAYSPDRLVAIADRALYAAKARERNCVVGLEA